MYAIGTDRAWATRIPCLSGAIPYATFAAETIVHLPTNLVLDMPHFRSKGWLAGLDR